MYVFDHSCISNLTCRSVLFAFLIAGAWLGGIDQSFGDNLAPLDVLFCETFDGYTFSDDDVDYNRDGVVNGADYVVLRKNAGMSQQFDLWRTSFGDTGRYNPSNPGIPEESEGAEEFWYGGRFGDDGDGQIEHDLAVQKNGGSSNLTPSGRIEDGAGLLFNVSTLGYTDVVLKFDWRTSGADRNLRAGFYIGNDSLGVSKDARVVDFVDAQGGPLQAASWWNDAWVEIISGTSLDFDHVIFQDSKGRLNSNPNLWFALWLDGQGEGSGLIDNIKVEGRRVPAPSTFGGLLSLVVVKIWSSLRRRR